MARRAVAPGNGLCVWDNPTDVSPDPRVFVELARTTAMIKVAPASVRPGATERTQPPAGGRFTLGRRASLLVSAGVVSHTLWTSAAPALTYGVYAQEWHLTHTVTAGIFAIYPLAVVVMLVGLGGISDQIGRRATMLAGLFASLVGALLFAVAPDAWWVFAGRALMGIGVGLTASPSTDAPLLLDTGCSPPHPAGSDVVLAASYGRRCGRRQALSDAVRSEGYTSSLRGVIDRHDGGVRLRRAGPVAWRPS